MAFNGDTVVTRTGSNQFGNVADQGRITWDNVGENERIYIKSIGFTSGSATSWTIDLRDADGGVSAGQVEIASGSSATYSLINTDIAVPKDADGNSFALVVITSGKTGDGQFTLTWESRTSNG